MLFNFFANRSASNKTYDLENKRRLYFETLKPSVEASILRIRQLSDHECSDIQFLEKNTDS